MPMIAGERIRHVIADWVAERAGDISSLSPGYEAFGVTNAAGELIGGVVYTSYRAGNRTVEMWCAGEGQWLTPRKLKAFFKYPFDELGCNRVSLIVGRENVESQRFVEKIGFIKEGACKDLLGPGKTALIYRMLKSECRWLTHG